MQRLYFDLDAGKLVVRPGYGAELREVSHKRGDSDRVELSFHRSERDAALTGEVTEMVYVVKANFGEDTPALIAAVAWTLDEETGIWSAPLGAFVDDLQEALGSAEVITVKAELTFTTTTMGTATSQTLTARVGNDLWKGTEGAPAALSSLDDWLNARRPPVMLRTLAQGPPIDQVMGVGETYHIDLSEVFIDVGGVAEFSVTAELSDSYLVTLLASDDENHLIATKIAAVLNANEGFSAVFEAEADEDILIVRYLSTDAPGLPGSFELAAADGSALVFDGGPYLWEDPVEVEAVAAVAGTQAGAIGHECRVGDSMPYRWFKAQSLSPTLWEETTPARVNGSGEMEWTRGEVTYYVPVFER